MIREIITLVRSRMVRDRRGTIATMVGLTAIPMVLIGGLALDGTRLWLLQTRLQEAVDASVLLAASPGETSVSTTQATTDTSNLFWADFGRVSRTGNAQIGFINTGVMGATITDTALAVTFPDSTHVQVAATATLPMTFMSLAGVSTHSVSASATAQRAGGVEMALVLDISLSMEFQLQDGTNNDKEQALQAAANSMLSALYGSNDTVPNLYVSVVPFAGAVNIGNSHTNWLDPTFTSGTFKGSVDTGNGSGWRGCVEARQNGYDLKEDSPSSAPFAPFFWPSTYQQYSKSGGGYYAGDNDWTTGSGGITETDSVSQTAIGAGILKGPNLGCPHSALLGPTASKTIVAKTINGLTLTGPVGTVIIQGMQWGWFALSPSWEGSNGWNVTNPGGASLPLSYAAPNNKKVIVLMTDGTTDVSGAQTWYGQANNWSNNESSSLAPACNNTNPSTDANMAPECIGSSSGGSTTPKATNWKGTSPDSWYSPYGRVSAGRVIQTPPNAPQAQYPDNYAGLSETATNMLSTQLDQNFLTLCSNIKQQGIIIYTIFFHSPEDDQVDGYLGSEGGVSTAESNLQNCATDSSHYYVATSTASINNAFVSIANQISALRLTQ